MLTSPKNSKPTVPVQSKHPSEIGPIKVYSKHQEEEGSQGSGSADQMVAGALAGVLRRGGGRRSAARARYRGGGSKRRTPRGAAAHQERGGGFGEAGVRSVVPESSTATAAGVSEEGPDSASLRRPYK